MTELPLNPRELYWLQVRHWAKREGSDGCTGVADIYVEACYEHDHHYQYGKTLYGDPITRAQADARFRQVIQSRSKAGRFSPMSWWRWAGVRLFGGLPWSNYRTKETV